MYYTKQFNFGLVRCHKNNLAGVLMTFCCDHKVAKLKQNITGNPNKIIPLP